MPSNSLFGGGRPLTVWWRASASALLLLLAAPAGAGTREDNGLPRRFFDPRTDRDFGDPRPALAGYLHAHRHRRTAQHFCVVGYVPGPDSNGKVLRFAQVHWREGGRLILWEGTDPYEPREALKRSRRDLDLRTDVVATDADVGGSTYLVTRAWVRQVLADCAARGRRYTLRP